MRAIRRVQAVGRIKTTQRGRGLGMGGHQHTLGESDEWLTPPDLLAQLGTFDLDPCSPINRPWDTARKHFTKKDDGLSLPWVGRVWLNPPYVGGASARWLHRLATHGDGLALIFARTETTWFHECVWQRADAALFLAGRLYFHRGDGSRAAANAGAPSVLVAYGMDNVDCLRDCGIPGQFVTWRQAGAA